VDAVLEDYDALLTASTLIAAPRFDTELDRRAVAGVVQTIQFNVTGHPAISVPTEITKQGLPLGVQVAGRAWDEATVLRVARAIEVLSGWEDVARPDIA
jgi:aspartyl-tRNA(Asn)/glutamyl-tRNA(Gln) amidotransferase subunit A